MKNIEKIIEIANSNLASYQHITGWSLWPDEDFPRSATMKVKKEEVLKRLSGKEKQLEKSDGKINTLTRILSQISGVNISHIHDETKVIRNLKLDSLMMVELIARIEEDFGVSIDQTLIEHTTTVDQLEKLIEKQEPAKKLPKLKRWPRFWLIYYITIFYFFIIKNFY